MTVRNVVLKLQSKLNYTTTHITILQFTYILEAVIAISVFATLIQFCPTDGSTVPTILSCLTMFRNVCILLSLLSTCLMILARHHESVLYVMVVAILTPWLGCGQDLVYALGHSRSSIRLQSVKINSTCLFTPSTVVLDPWVEYEKLGRHSVLSESPRITNELSFIDLLGSIRYLGECISYTKCMNFKYRL